MAGVRPDQRPKARKAAGRILAALCAAVAATCASYAKQVKGLSIRARAETRLAEEYDAAQERGEMAKSGQRGKAVSGENSFWTPKGSPEFEEYRNERPPLMDRPATYGDLEFSAKDIHEARQMREAEAADPGIVDRTVNDMVDRGEEPTRAAMRQSVLAAVEDAKRKPTVFGMAHRLAHSTDNTP